MKKSKTERPVELQVVRELSRELRPRHRRRRLVARLSRTSGRIIVPVAIVVGLIAVIGAFGYFRGSGTGSGTATAGIFANPVTHLSVTAPSTATAGSPFTVTVTAKDAFGNTVPNYAGIVHFTSSDLAAGVLLPIDFSFSAGDHGTHTFTNEATLDTAGSQTVTATDTVNASYTGLATVNVAAAAVAAKFLVQAPATTTAGAPLTVSVTALDQFSNVATSYTGTIHFTSSDTAAGVILPPDYAFVAGDHGAHTFPTAATLVTVPSLPATSQSIRATDSTSMAITGKASVGVTVGAASKIVLSGGTALQVGTGETLTATIEDAFGNPIASGGDSTANVAFAKASGTGTLTGFGSPAASGGVATDSVTGNTAGTANVAATATLGGNPTTSNTLPIVVSAGTATDTLGASQNPTSTGHAVIYTATVAGGGVTPTGMVTFDDGGVAISPACTNVTLVSGVASCTVTYTTTAGSPRQITAPYSGDGNYGAVASNTVSESLGKATSTDTLTASPNPSTVGTLVTYTATVTGGGATPTGNVTFKDSGNAIACVGAPSGTVALDGGGVATCAITYTTTANAPHAITAPYAGDGGYNGDAGNTVTQVVNTATPTNSLANSSPTTLGSTVTFTATVGGPGATPTGTVTWTVSGPAGITTCASSTTALSAGTPTCSITVNNTGNYSVTETYSGDANYASVVSNTIALNVSKANSSAGLTSSLNPATVGAIVTYTVTVTGAGATPTGTVTFMDGAIAIAACGGPVAVVGGIATCSVSYATVPGSPHSITAVYTGDGNYLTSTSSPLTETVNQGTPSDTLGGSPNPTTVGTPVTYTATVAAGGGTTPGGTVTFKDGGVAVAACGVNHDGVVTLDGSGVATCTVTYTTTAGSPHTITAPYSGNANYVGVASTTVNEVVNQGSQTITFTSTAPTTGLTGGTYTPTATASSGLPVAFTIDASSAAVCSLSGGVVTFNTAGTCVIDANQAGNADYTAAPQQQQSVTIASADLRSVVGAWACTTCAWAVGDNGTILYGNGASFSAEVSGVTTQLNGVTAPFQNDDNHVWAVGNDGTILECTASCVTPASAVWVKQVSNTTANLYAVGGARDSGSDVWAVGAGGVIDHWNGATWTPQTVGTHDLLGTGTYARGHGANFSAWAVGTAGTMLVTSDGTTWTAQTSAASGTLRSVSSYQTGANDAWAVGDGGVILKTTNGGGTWSQVSAAVTTSNLFGVADSVSSASPSAGSPIYAVGAGGTILVSADGTTFAAKTSGTTKNLLGVNWNTSGNAWAVGQGGTILYSSNAGATWTPGSFP